VIYSAKLERAKKNKKTKETWINEKLKSNPMLLKKWIIIHPLYVSIGMQAIYYVSDQGKCE